MRCQLGTIEAIGFAQFGGFKHPPYGQFQLVEIDRLGQEVSGTFTDGADSIGYRAVTGQDNDRILVAYFAENPRRVAVWQFEIEDDGAGLDFA